jgi:hypothetical protein
MSATINLVGSSTTPGTPPLTAPVVNVAVNAALAANYTTASAETVRALAAEALLAPLASPVFSGSPTLPTGTIATTQAPGNSSTAPATTAFVAAAALAASGVTTFNTRLGAVTLSSTDVTTALTFTPYNATNPSGFQTAAQVATTLSPYATTASVPALAPVQSVATRAGAVSLTHSDLTDWATATASFGSSSFARSARTSNTILGVGDKGTLVDITSGTFGQTFTASATLAAGWFCYLRNSGTGAITLTPNGAETIDGLTSFVMYPQEFRLVLCTGAALFSEVLHPFYQTYTASIVAGFVKPPGYSLFQGLLWGAGGGANKSGNAGSPANGGGGGAATPFSLPASVLSATTDVTIGAGGVGQTVANTGGSNGGDSTFGPVVSPGGAVNGAGGSPGQGQAYPNGSGWPAVYDGSFGPTTSAARTTVFGGGGGSGCSSSGTAFAAGLSMHGGPGGASSSAGSGSNGSAPGGGGGATQTGTTGGAGARGELRIWGIA